MSAFEKKGVRCDWCGKFSANRDGEYMKPGTVNVSAYIRQAFPPENDNGSDICEECRDGVCPKCRSVDVVKITPATPGPDGWGGRCMTCGHRWEMVVNKLDTCGLCNRDLSAVPFEQRLIVRADKVEAALCDSCWEKFRTENPTSFKPSVAITSEN